MLTNEALRERKWGAFPTLRKVLEDKQVPDSYYGLSTADDDIFSFLIRTLKIAAVAHEHRDLIRQRATTLSPEAMHHDLCRLEEMINAACHHLTRAARQVREISSSL